MKLALILICGSLAAQEAGRLRLIPPPTTPDARAGKHVDIGYPNAAGSPIWDGVSSSVSWGPAGGSNAVNVSPTNPMYLYVAFSDDDSAHLYFHSSLDALNFDPIQTEGSVGASIVRDPSIIERPSTSPYRFLILTSNNQTQRGQVQLFKTNDLHCFNTTACGPDQTAAPIYLNTSGYISPAATDTYGPEWAVNPSSGALGFFVPLGNTGPLSLFWVSYNETTDAISQNAITVTGLGSSSTNLILDPYYIYDSAHSVHYLFFTNLDVTTGKQYTSFATASSFLGPYAQQTPVPSSTSTGDRFHFGDSAEATSIMPLPSGCMRIFNDTFIGVYAPRQTLPRRYTWKYVDTCGTVTGGTQDSAGVWSPDAVGAGGGSNPFANIMNYPAQVHIPHSEHGTVIKITSPDTAAIIYNAKSKYRNPFNYASRIRFGDPTGDREYAVEVKSKNAQYGLQYDEPAAIGLVTSDGHKAAFQACGPTYATCPPPQLTSDAVLLLAHDPSRPGPMMQISSHGTDYGEVSFAYINGASAWGNDLTSSSSMSLHGIWTQGFMNTYLGLATPGKNFGNNTWFLSNAGLGPSLVTNPVVVNPGFELGTGYTSPTPSAVSTDTTIFHDGAQSVKMTGTNVSICQTVSGLTSGTTYQVNAWNYGQASQHSPVTIQVDDGTGANATGSVAIALGAYWQLLSQPYKANGTGNVKFCLVTGDDGSGLGGGPVYWDTVSITTPTGAFAFTVSAQTGMTHATYGLEIGGGDATPLSNVSWGTLHATAPGLMSLDTATAGDHNGYLALGTLSTQGSILLGPRFSEYVGLCSSALNILNIGDQTTPCNNNGIVKAGIFDMASVLRNGGVDLTSGLGAATTWIKPVNTTGNVSALTVTGTNVYAGSGYVGTSLGLGNNFNPASPLANLTAPSSGQVFLNTTNTSDRNAIVLGGYFDALNLFSVNGVNGISSGLTAAYNCTFTLITYKNASGVNQSTNVCTGLATATATFTGGIRTN